MSYSIFLVRCSSSSSGRNEGGLAGGPFDPTCPLCKAENTKSFKCNLVILQDNPIVFTVKERALDMAIRRPGFISSFVSDLGHNTQFTCIIYQTLEIHVYNRLYFIQQLLSRYQLYIYQSDKYIEAPSYGAYSEIKWEIKAH